MHVWEETPSELTGPLCQKGKAYTELDLSPAEEYAKILASSDQRSRLGFELGHHRNRLAFVRDLAFFDIEELKRGSLICIFHDVDKLQ